MERVEKHGGHAIVQEWHDLECVFVFDGHIVPFADCDDQL